MSDTTNPPLEPGRVDKRSAANEHTSGPIVNPPVDGSRSAASAAADQQNPPLDGGSSRSTRGALATDNPSLDSLSSSLATDRRTSSAGSNNNSRRAPAPRRPERPPPRRRPQRSRRPRSGLQRSQRPRRGSQRNALQSPSQRSDRAPQSIKRRARAMRSRPQWGAEEVVPL
jgi:hypothetical protein